MLCGINLPFGRLFPSMRQVTHVLLTRPPLIHSRRSFIARLACVRHAASVRPEPGSDSQFKSLNCFKQFADYNSQFFYIFRCEHLQNRFSNELTGFTYIYLFNFQRPIRHHLTTFTILLGFNFFVNTFLKLFFKFFKCLLKFKSLSLELLTCLPQRQDLLYIF